MAKPTGSAMERAQNMAATSKSTTRQKADNAVSSITSAFDDSRVTSQLVRVTPPNLRDAITPEILLANALMEIRTNTYLQQCTPISVIGSVIRAARLGLVPDGMLGHSYLIPRRVKGIWNCQLQLGYRGISLLCHQSNGIVFSCRVVSEGDEYDYEEGLNAFLKHKRKLDRKKTPEWAEFIFAYSIAMFKDGRKDFRLLTIADLEKARGSSDSYKRNPAQSPWTKWPEAMAEKTCLIKHSKQLPLSTKTMTEILRDEKQEIGQMLQTSRMGDQEVETSEVDIDGGVVEASVVEPPRSQQRADDPPPHDEPPSRDKPCDHPLSCREDDGACGSCGEVFQEEGSREPGSDG